MTFLSEPQLPDLNEGDRPLLRTDEALAAGHGMCGHTERGQGALCTTLPRYLEISLECSAASVVSDSSWPHGL